MKAIWKAWRPLQRATIIALVLALLVTFTAFAISLFVSMPFTGNIYDLGDTPNVTQVMTNDDGVETGIAGDWDETDSGDDPSGLQTSVPPFIAPRFGYDIQNCAATINGGGGIDLVMADTSIGTYCAVWMRVAGDTSTEIFEWVEATVVGGAPVEIVEQPACGSISVSPGGSVPGVVLQVSPAVTALPGETWDGATASIDVEWGVPGTYTCP